MLTIRNKIAPTWFALPGHAEPKPEFLLRPLSSVAWIDVRNEITSDGHGNATITGEGALCAAQSAVTDWRNVMTEGGEQITFTRQGLADLERSDLLLLASEIIDRAYLSETERKNS